MPYRILMLASLMMVFELFAQAAEAPRDDVARLVVKLSSASRAERVEGERTLSEGDVAVLKDLPPRESITDPAVQLALDRIRARLLERRAVQDVSPTIIDGQQIATMGDLVNASGSQLTVSDKVAALKIDLPDEHLTLWQAVDAAAEQHDLRPVVAQTIGLREREPTDAERAIAHSGAFRFVASPVRLKEIAGSDDEHLARVILDVQVEPRLRPLFLSYASDAIPLSAKGKTLRPFSPKAHIELPFGEGERSVTFPLDFVADSSLAPPFVFAGRIRATVAAGEERFRFRLGDSTAARRSQAGVTVELHTFEKNSDGSAIAGLSVVYDEGGPAFESHRTWVYHNHAFLTFKTPSDDDVRLNHEPGFSTLAISSGGVKLAYRFADLPPDAKEIVFNYEAPTKIVDVPVNFEMNGVPRTPSINAESASDR